MYIYRSLELPLLDDFLGVILSFVLPLNSFPSRRKRYNELLFTIPQRNFTNLSS